MRMNLLYQDAHMVVCVKPAGLLAQADSKGGESAVSKLEAAFGSIYPVHRLDKDTGGVMVFARTQKAAAALSKAVQENRLNKEYLALLPEMPAAEAGELEDILFHDRVKNRTYVVDRQRKGAKPAKLAYRVLEQRESAVLVQVRLFTGRTHQIRVQFASRKLPLLGDRKYGSRESVPMALWAWRLTLPHPVTGKELVFAAMPDGAAAPWNRVSTWPTE
jgi:23S rRNA pseudouridine1911/1915/1917 synthase